MRISELFVKPVERPIEGVIKADDQRHLETEVEEFVITREIAKGLSEFVERYLEEPGTNGVWISGFFGSGKSHLLKIVSLLLDRNPLPSGRHPSEIILPKIEDEILRGDLQRACQVPATSILFNIDQKADQIGGDPGAPILSVYLKVLNELRGYHGKQGHIAQFEHGLAKKGQLDGFKDAWQAATGTSWEDARIDVEYLENETFAKVYSEFAGVSEDEALRLFDRSRENFKVSIESFAEQVKEYIDSQGPDFRLNFFVDEVGQFIGPNSQLMLNLQTVAESLATKCEGRAWVLVTSQGDLKRVLGELDGTVTQDFTKIQGRFKTRLTLTSADVKEVIQKRLLAKKEAEPEVLTTVYDKEKENLVTLYRFSDDSVQYKGWRGSDEFCDFYPFHPYQFDLFQRCIEQLSRHDMFTGRHTSVGERSMLEVFQSVVKGMRKETAGELATFDRMFDGIAATLRGDAQTSIQQAQGQLDNPLAVRILKALFLLKWVREFKATPRNIAILLIDRSDVEIAAHEKAIKEALELLARQSYLQRNGDVYEFLTDTEKDIEVEIKNTDIDESEVTKLLSDVLFKDILRDPKVRYEANGQDYSYARKLDDQLVGKDSEVALNIITPDHPNHGNQTALAAQCTGKPELVLVLPPDLHLMDEVRLFLKTQKFIQQNSGSGTDEARRSILNERGRQNSTRRTNLKELCSELFTKAPVFLNGSKLESISYSEPRNRFHKAAQELIAFAFPNLRMLKGSYDENTLSAALLSDDDLLTSGQQPLSEAEQEILTYVQRNQNEGERTSAEEMIRQFGRRPYGWYPMAVATLLGRLFRMGKVELRTTEPLDARSALECLKNSRQHGALRVRLQEQFDSSKINALKRFHQEFFDRPNGGTDARSVGQLTAEAFSGEKRDLGVLLDQTTRYSFLGKLKPAADKIGQLADKDYAYFLNHLGDFEDELLDAKEDYLDPIKSFMHGAQRVAYDEVIAFLKEEEANFPDLPQEEVQPLRDLAAAEAPYRGDGIPAAKTAATALRQRIDKLLTAERVAGASILDDHEQRIRALDDFSKLDADAQAEVLTKTTEARNAIALARFLTAIRDRLNRYRDQDYPAQLERAARLAAPAPAGGGNGGGPSPAAPTYVPANSLRASCALPYIATEAKLDQWLASLRSAALKEIEKGHRISL
jgi:hypothetical protein